MDKTTEIEALMYECIKAIEAIEWEQPLAILNSFPNSGCTLASYYLGHLLEARGFGKWQIVNGSAGVMASHDWLESLEYGLVVDPTAHQFKKLGFKAPFVAAGISPLEERFIRQQSVDLNSWSTAYERGYELVLASMKTLNS